MSTAANDQGQPPALDELRVGLVGYGEVGRILAEDLRAVGVAVNAYDLKLESPSADADTMREIVDVHFPGIKPRLVAEALRLFYEIREVPGMKKKPSTSELLDWLKLLMVEDIGPELLRERDPKKLIPPLHGALIKNEQDVHLFERLAFMARREGR